MTDFAAEFFERRVDQAAGWEIGVTTYKVKDRWICKIDNISPGATIARASSNTREEAQRRALDKAIERLSTTKRR